MQLIEQHLLISTFVVTQCHVIVFFPLAGSDGAASSYHVKQLEEQNSRLKEALVRSVTVYSPF